MKCKNGDHQFEVGETLDKFITAMIVITGISASASIAFIAVVLAKTLFDCIA